jgi:hypothetical protein
MPLKSEKSIKLEFKKGGVFEADLYWEKAPETCKALWELLPLTLEVGHAKFSGHALYVFPGISLKVMENSRCIGLLPGEILYNPHVTNSPPHPNELSFVYGLAAMRDSFGYAAFNLIGKIKEDQIQGFVKIGERIDRKGNEGVVITKNNAE